MTYRKTALSALWVCMAALGTANAQSTHLPASGRIGAGGGTIKVVVSALEITEQRIL